jgi:hypothetical protein
MLTKRMVGGFQPRRAFIQSVAAALFTSGLSLGALVESWAGDSEGGGIDARKLAAIKPDDLQRVTFAALSTSPCLEPNQPLTDDEKKKWAEVMTAVFPEGLDKLKGMGWAKYDESKGIYVVASDRAKVRLATAHLFAIRRTPFGGSKHAFRQYAEFIASLPLEEVNGTGNPYGNSPPELFDAFFNSGSQLVFVKGGLHCLDAQARDWEKDNNVELRGGSTLAGVSIILTPQPSDLCWPENGGVKLTLIKREIDARNIAAHGKGFLDVAMMKDAIRTKYKALTGEKAAWQQAFCRNLKADLKAQAGLSAKMDALDGMADRSTLPQEDFLDAVLAVAAESLTAKVYPEDLKLINGVQSQSLFLESSLPEASRDSSYPGYRQRPRTKTTAAVNTVLAAKGTVVSKAIRETAMEARYRQLSAIFLKESDLKPDWLSALEEVFQGIFDALGPRRAEFLKALKQRQEALKTDRTVQQVEEKRECYLSNMVPLRRVEFVDAAYDGFLEVERALKEK